MTRWQFRILAVFALLGGLFGGALTDLVMSQSGANAQALRVPSTPPRVSAVGSGAVVEARELKIVDATGAVVARLGIAEGAASMLALYDAKGVARAQLRVGSDGAPTVALSDSAGRCRAMLGVQSNGLPALRLADNAGNARVEAAYDPKDGPWVRLAGLAPAEALFAVRSDDSPCVRLSAPSKRGQTPTLRAELLAATQGDARLRLCAPGGEQRMLARVATDGAPLLSLMGDRELDRISLGGPWYSVRLADAAGSVVWVKP